MQEVANTREIGLEKMLEEIRDRHIDIVPIIEEELKGFLLGFIEDVIRGVYENQACEVAQ